MPTPSSLPARLVTSALALAVATGGGLALAGPARAAEGFAFSSRIGGADRFSTAVAASRAAFPDGAGAVVVVNGYRVVDGLTASYVAGLHDAPVLYTEAGDLPRATEEEVARLGATEVYVVGGTAVVGTRVEEQLAAQGRAVTRFGGDDRFATAAQVATSAGGGSPEKVLVASGVKLSDALVVGPLAYARGYPILLVDGDAVPTATTDALARLGAPTRIAVGGTTVVGPRAYEAVDADDRLDGLDRAGTAVAVAEHAVRVEGFSAASVGLVSGSDQNTADALVATPLAGERGFPLLFSAGEGIPAPTAEHLAAVAPQLTGQGYVFGDTGAVPDAAVQAATLAAGGR